MQHDRAASDVAELFKVSVIGAGGFVATIQLTDVATFVSICVGVATFAYVMAKLYFLIKSGGKSGQ